jgi:hypothetical protein|tara:strand:- start:413 stop:607 length:195 start_codon:yes stop_codon:yes gene_type:complete
MKTKLVDQHTINGATLLGVGLTVFALTDKMGVDTFGWWVFVIAPWFFILLSLYEFMWQGVIKKL